MKRCLLVVAAAVSLLSISLSAQPKHPDEFLSMKIGADGVLADYDQIERWFLHLDETSGRVRTIDLGETTLGLPMIMAVISSEANIANLPAIRDQAAKLADPRRGGDVDELAENGKAVVLVTCNIHSTEIGSSQMAMLWAWELATAPPGSKQAAWLDDVVLLLVPSLNPDGQQMIVDWYRAQKGTDFEGGWMPKLYHHYVGHDNNRDWFMLTQNETRALSRALYHEWFPQILVDHHQMGAIGPRMFIPPFSDPLDPDIHPLIWREIQLIGSMMSMRLEQAGKAGVIYDYGYDAYWMGGTRNTGWWKNITGLLTETASVRIATPIYVHPTELAGGRKGLLAYKPQVNFPNPWKGGWWRLKDIIEYQQISANALLEVASMHREDFLRDIRERAESAIQMASEREAYKIPRSQKNRPTARKLAELMADHGVDVMQDGEGNWWIPLDQPYARFVREILGPQKYMEIRKAAGADPLAPFDVSTWSLPLLMNVEVEHTRIPFDVQLRRITAPIMGGLSPAAPPLANAAYYAIPRASAESAKLVNEALRTSGSAHVMTESSNSIAEVPVPALIEAGTWIVDPRGAEAARRVAGEAGVDILPVREVPETAVRVGRPRVGIYQPTSLPSMDEGWTRFVLERFGFDPATISPSDLRSPSRRGLRASFDAVILPDIGAAQLVTGEREPQDGQRGYFPGYPAEYAGGFGEAGEQSLMQFVRDGGTLIALDSSSEWVLKKFNLPVSNAIGSASKLSAPGALLRVNVDQGTPLTWGLGATVPVFHDDKIAFRTTVPGAETKRRVLAWYPEDPEEILLSGWIDGEEELARTAAAVALEHGGGRIVLFGFRPQNRAQTHGTYPLLFNAIYWSVTDHGL
ncbi:MAG: hypothetical protein KY459_15480 [Acidobacteria bacterium]|nr:hypothetical protein [Acidobacteriota bacterium]